MSNFEKRYLGDGVYASFDGYQVWLHVNHHLAPPVVALEPAVIDALNRYFYDVAHPRATSTVDAHEAENVSDKPAAPEHD